MTLKNRPGLNGSAQQVRRSGLEMRNCCAIQDSGRAKMALSGLARHLRKEYDSNTGPQMVRVCILHKQPIT